MLAVPFQLILEPFGPQFLACSFHWLAESSREECKDIKSSMSCFTKYLEMASVTAFFSSALSKGRKLGKEGKTAECAKVGNGVSFEFSSKSLSVSFGTFNMVTCGSESMQDPYFLLLLEGPASKLGHRSRRECGHVVARKMRGCSIARFQGALPC